MARFVIVRLLQAIPVLLLVITATFFLLRLAPGGPFDGDRRLPPQVEKQLRQHYNLDDSLTRQYLRYLGNLAQGDLGPSFRYPTRSVNEIIAAGIGASAELALWAFIYALFAGVGIGMLAAIHRNGLWDYLPMGAAMVGICLPSFLLGPLLILLFGIHLGWLPIAGWGITPLDKVLPIATLGSVYAAYIARLTRASAVEVLERDFVRTARAKGLSPARILLRHCLPATIIPIVAFCGPALAGLISGSFVIETLFQIPGVGRFYVQGAFNRDYTMIMGTTIFFAVLIIGFNLLADIIGAWLDPKVREAQFQR